MAFENLMGPGRRLALGLGVAATLAFGGTQAMAETLRLGNEGTYPPFSMVDTTGTLTGIEPDLAREMCKRMAVECEFVVMDFKALIPSLLQNKIDVVASQVKPLAERKERALFGLPVFWNPDTFVVRKDSTYTFTNEGLAGVKIGLQRGSSQAKFIEVNFPAMEKIYYDNPDQIRLDLLAGRVDATFSAKINWTIELIEKPEGKDYMLAGGDFWTGEDSVPENERGSSWIVNKGQEALLARMDETLKAMLADCSFTKIREKYLSVAIAPQEAACAK
ncbi:transporter substrate-binding domain-containing protein [Zavarzinia sp. CC-PAN008]|uniref:transporter substrate-binding domain-containing protein n=1 Tax=Zavarzinia sp. CC-PAN008 TaxID=3243332 RepID=UPI003F746F6A